MQAQMDVEEALRRADFVLTNDGAEADLEKSVRFLDTLLRKL
jgi:dephospho-CoA kinase